MFDTRMNAAMTEFENIPIAHRIFTHTCHPKIQSRESQISKSRAKSAADYSMDVADPPLSANLTWKDF
jgi:hypothetical protein